MNNIATRSNLDNMKTFEEIRIELKKLPLKKKENFTPKGIVYLIGAILFLFVPLYWLDGTDKYINILLGSIFGLPVIYCFTHALENKIIRYPLEIKKIIGESPEKVYVDYLIDSCSEWRNSRKIFTILKDMSTLGIFSGIYYCLTKAILYYQFSGFSDTFDKKYKLKFFLFLIASILAIIAVILVISDSYYENKRVFLFNNELKFYKCKMQIKENNEKNQL